MIPMIYHGSFVCVRVRCARARLTIISHRLTKRCDIPTVSEANLINTCPTLRSNDVAIRPPFNPP